jgi:hypothetical protein
MTNIKVSLMELGFFVPYLLLGLSSGGIRTLVLRFRRQIIYHYATTAADIWHRLEIIKVK